MTCTCVNKIIIVIMLVTIDQYQHHQVFKLVWFLCLIFHHFNSFYIAFNTMHFYVP